jgi:hypothetical protein
MERPLIQIGDEIREMTDEEYENYEAIISLSVSVNDVE